jgi:hypothetical protein
LGENKVNFRKKFDWDLWICFKDKLVVGFWRKWDTLRKSKCILRNFYILFGDFIEKLIKLKWEKESWIRNFIFYLENKERRCRRVFGGNLERE